MVPELTAALAPGPFVNEIEIASGLNHPHVLPLESGTARLADGAELPFYVMP
jgi:hypothetical protein